MRTARVAVLASVFFLGTITICWGQIDEATGVPTDSLDAFREFVQRLEANGEECGAELLASSIAVDAVIERAAGDLEVPAALRRGLVEGLRVKLTLGQEICDAVRESGSYSLLRVRRIDGQPRALFRLVSNAGLNYHDHLLARAPDGEIQIHDFYSYLTGEWFSRTLRRSILPVVAEANRIGLADLTRSESAYVRNLPRVLEISRLASQQNFEAALEIFDQFPPELKKDRNLLLLRFNLASQASEEAYKAAMRDLKNTFPDDPALQLTLIDHYYYQGEYGKVLEIIDGIDTRLEGDPYLDYFRANVFYTDGQYSKARKLARRAIRREPALEEPYWTLVAISLDQRDFRETASVLAEIEDELHQEIADLTEIPEYSAFVESEAYRRWMDERRVR